MGRAVPLRSPGRLLRFMAFSPYCRVASPFEYLESVTALFPLRRPHPALQGSLREEVLPRELGPAGPGRVHGPHGPGRAP